MRQKMVSHVLVFLWVITKQLLHLNGVLHVKIKTNLAASSHQKMAAAYEEGFFDDLITPFLGLERDNNLRADSTVEKLAKLKPVLVKAMLQP
jgi:acetyl-CoA acetyltransferase